MDDMDVSHDSVVVAGLPVQQSPPDSSEEMQAESPQDTITRSPTQLYSPTKSIQVTTESPPGYHHKVPHTTI